MTEIDVPEKALKMLGTLRTYREGMLFKRQRGLHSNQKKLKFQERFCRLTSHSLDYFDPHPKKRVSISAWRRCACRSCRCAALTGC
jgi:hypothetical protein